MAIVASLRPIDIAPAPLELLGTAVGVIILAAGEEVWFRGEVSELFSDEELPEPVGFLLPVALFALSHLYNLRGGQAADILHNLCVMDRIWSQLSASPRIFGDIGFNTGMTLAAILYAAAAIMIIRKTIFKRNENIGS